MCSNNLSPSNIIFQKGVHMTPQNILSSQQTFFVYFTSTFCFLGLIYIYIYTFELQVSSYHSCSEELTHSSCCSSYCGVSL
ncbi:hypothetical protein DsansV1_C08g0085411 [Dioscorea sansibarensis]